MPRSKDRKNQDLAVNPDAALSSNLSKLSKLKADLVNPKWFRKAQETAEREYASDELSNPAYQEFLMDRDEDSAHYKEH